MADYDPNAGTDISNGSGGAPDWWMQNQPAAPPPGAVNTTSQQGGNYVGRDGHIYTPDGQDLGPSGQAPIPTDAQHGAYNPNAPYNPPAAPPTGPQWGGPVAPYQGGPYPTFTPPPLPDYLQKGFQLPSAGDLQATPGYMERFNMGLKARDRSAAANGTILNGGTQQALARYGQDYASGEYSNLVNQKLGERQQQSSDYLNLAYGPAWQTNQAAVNQYGTLYGQYRDNLAANKGAQDSYWQQQMDLLNAGLGAAKSGNPGSTGG